MSRQAKFAFFVIFFTIHPVTIGISYPFSPQTIAITAFWHNYRRCPFFQTKHPITPLLSPQWPPTSLNFVTLYSYPGIMTPAPGGPKQVLPNPFGNISKNLAPRFPRINYLSAFFLSHSSHISIPRPFFAEISIISARVFNRAISSSTRVRSKSTNSSKSIFVNKIASAP